MQQVSLGDVRRAWVLLDADRVTGQGMVAPRLCFQMRARTPRERMAVEIHLMRAELVIGPERLGEGFLTGIPLAHGERPITIEIPVSRPALDYLESISPAERVDLELRLTGWLRGRDENEDAQRFVGDPAPGEAVFQHFGEARQTRPLSRSKSPAAIGSRTSCSRSALSSTSRPRSSCRTRTRLSGPP